MGKRTPLLCRLGLHWWKEVARWVGEPGKEQAILKVCRWCNKKKAVSEKFLI